MRAPSYPGFSKLAMLAFSIALAGFHLYEKQFLKMKRHFPENTGMASLGSS
jgi:hypothetical protein